MTTIGSERQMDAARHEAGHAIVGVRSGGVLNELHVRLEEGRWLGDCTFQKGKVSAEDLAAGAIAGCMAQAKSVAENQNSLTVVFSKSADLRALVHILRDSDRKTPGVDPGSCDMQFLADGRQSTITFDGAWFSGADAARYRLARGTMFPGDSADIQLIRSVMADLDDSKNWRAVCAIAEAISLRQASEDGRIILKGEEVLRIIADSDGECGREPA